MQTALTETMTNSATLLSDKTAAETTAAERSQIIERLDLLRTPVVTARGLADALGVSPQAALGLLRQLTAAGAVREATGRAAWRAFTTA